MESYGLVWYCRTSWCYKRASEFFVESGTSALQEYGLRIDMALMEGSISYQKRERVIQIKLR